MKFTYRWDETQFLHSALYDYYLGAQKRRLIFQGVLLLALAGILAIKWLNQGFQALDLLLLALGALGFAWRRLLLVRMFRRAFKRSGQQALDLCFDLNEEGLSVQVDQRAPQIYAWPDIQRVVRTEQGFLLYPGPLWLPLQGLEPQASVNQVAAFLQRKVAFYQDKSRYSLKTKI